MSHLPYTDLYKSYLNHQNPFWSESTESTESILVNMTDEWLEAMDKGHYTGLLFLDFRKAFDLIHHDILLKKLAVYGFSQSTINLFKSYLTNRRQNVMLNGDLSDPQTLYYGVPQGTILGPTLFLLFINDLAINWRNNSGLYADDATVYTSAPNLYTIQQKLQADIDITLKWTEENAMAINHDKTSYMIMGTRQKLSRLDDCALYLWLGQHQIKRSTSECLLGIHIDLSLSWEIQIEELRKKLLKRIGVLQRLKKYLPLKYRLMLFNASIKPVMEYCLSVWGNCGVGLLDDIFKLQKRCARLMLDDAFDSRSLELFRKLNWYPIDKLCLASRLHLFKKIRNKLAPEYLINKLETFKYSHRYSTRLKSEYHLPVPKTNNLKRSFFYNVIKHWDNLDDSIRSSKHGKEHLASMMNNYSYDNFKVATIF